MTQPPVFQNMEYPSTVDFENFDLLFSRYGPSLYGIILKAAEGNALIAERLMGQAFVQIYRNKDLYDPARQRPLIWMIAIVAQLIKKNGYNNKLAPVINKRTETDSDNLNLIPS
jgi:hypothetical protein